MTSRLTDQVIALALVTLALAVWEISVRVQEIPVYILPAPSRILSTLGQNANLYAEASLLTLGEAIAGLMLGTIAGIGAATLLSLWPRLESGIMTLAILVKSTPLIAIHAANRDRTTADDLARFWRAAQNHHHRFTNFFSSAGQCTQWIKRSRPRHVRYFPVVECQPR